MKQNESIEVKSKRIILLYIVIISIYLISAFLGIITLLIDSGILKAIGIDAINDKVKCGIIIYQNLMCIASFTAFVFLFFKFIEKIKNWFTRLRVHYKVITISSLFTLLTTSIIIISKIMGRSIIEPEFELIRIICCFSMAGSTFWIIYSFTFHWDKYKENSKTTIKIIALSTYPIAYLVFDSFSSKLVNEIFGIPASLLPLTQRFVTIYLSIMLVFILIEAIILMRLLTLMVKSFNTKIAQTNRHRIYFDILLNASIMLPLAISFNWISQPSTKYIKNFAAISDFSVDKHLKFDTGCENAIIIEPEESFAITISSDGYLKLKKYETTLYSPCGEL